MEKINLTISPQELAENETESIMIRKFFNMIFVGLGGMSLHIYTAIVFSAGKTIENNDYFPSVHNNKFGLKFQYENVKKIRFTDLSKSLFEQEELLGKIWGNSDLLSSQKKVRSTIEEVYSREPASNIELPKQAIYISDSRKSDFYKSVVCEGKFAPWENDYYFTLAEEYKSEGLEYLNWVKTEVELIQPLVNNKLEFTITFDIPQNVRCYCPDYMWYTCIPEELVNDLSEAMVKIKDNPPALNLMQRLADNTALRLHEWVTDESIDRCKRYRLLFEGQSSEVLDGKSRISVTMSILQRRNKQGNKQFIVGLLLAFLLAYASDWTRLSEIQKYLFATGSFSAFTYIADILFPICIICMYLSIIMPIARVAAGLDVGIQFCIKICKIVGIAAIAIGLMLFFVVLPVIKLCSMTIPNWIQGLIIACMILGLVISAIYIGLGCLWKKLDFYDYF